MAPFRLPQMSTFPASSIFSFYASISALLFLIRSILNEFIPKPIRNHVLNLFHKLFSFRSNKLTFVIEELSSTGIGRNHLYDVVELNLAQKMTSRSPSTGYLKLSKSPKDKFATIRFQKNEQFQELFEDIPLQWTFCCSETERRRRNIDEETGSSFSIFETRSFELSFDKRHQPKAMHKYLPSLEAKYKSIKENQRDLKLHTIGQMYLGSGVNWVNTNLDHPSTFQTIAMDPDQKSLIIDDLDMFKKRKEFYKRIGRAWKRGYLLSGPPGTGKSSLIAAMANHLKFDIYDLQLGSLMKDSDLRRVLLSIPDRSILVIEDIDCSVDFKDRSESSSSENGKIHKILEPQLTLSGLLNFIDGLWSSCGEARVIILTTNHKEKLDPALLRPGRMDMHIEMPYLSVQGFRTLAFNYLGVEIGSHHRLLGEIETHIETTQVTPAEVAEQLMRTNNKDQALEEVLKLLKAKDEMKNMEVLNSTMDELV